LLEAATEEQQMPNPWWQTSDYGRMWQRTTAADERQHREMKACQRTTVTVGG
jgi:hypothetical protein